MKLSPYILLVLVFNTFILKAQTVVIEDTAFQSCLVKKLPSFLDNNSNLLIDSAKHYKGTLNCNGFGIKNTTIIQYFDSIDVLNLSRNSISSIDLFPTNSLLTRLILDDNNLSSLPSTSSLSNLRTLQVKRNQLSSLPDLSSNKLLSQLYVEDNELTSLPNLDSLTILWAIDASKNNLQSLPNLNNNTGLKELVVAKNALEVLPSLEQLPSLSLIDASGNKLKTLPLTNTNNEIKSIDISNNQFSSLPDFAGFDSINRVYLNDNYLSFKELENLISIPGYDTIFPLTQQHYLLDHQNKTIEKLSTEFLTAAIDSGLNSVNYQWFYNGKPYSTEQQVKLLSDNITQSGYYNYQITHTAFPNLQLHTDSFFIEVLPCFNTNTFTIEVLNRSCLNNAGELQITSNASLTEDFIYQLSPQKSNQVLNSSDGHFINLGEREYTLIGTINNCSEIIQEAIIVEDANCKDPVITADNDGVDDEYFINREGIAIIRDKFGNEVETLTLPSSWNGTSNGTVVAPGLYYIDINQGEQLIKLTVVH